MSRTSHPDVAALVLAAGQGTRMKSDLAKVLHPVAGRPLLAWVLDAVGALGVARVLVVVGRDTPLLEAPTLEALLAHHAATGAAVTVLSMRLPDPAGYGRIVRDPAGGIAAIVEERDASPAVRALDEVNSGNYAFDYPALAAVLGTLGTHNAQHEYYLTDTVA